MFFISVQAICWGALATSALCLTINTWATRRYLGIPLLLQLRDWLPGFVLAAACTWIPALLLGQLPSLPQLTISLLLCLSLYLCILKLAVPSTLRSAWQQIMKITH